MAHPGAEPDLEDSRPHRDRTLFACSAAGPPFYVAACCSVVPFLSCLAVSRAGLHYVSGAVPTKLSRHMGSCSVRAGRPVPVRFSWPPYGRSHESVASGFRVGRDSCRTERPTNSCCYQLRNRKGCRGFVVLRALLGESPRTIRNGTRKQFQEGKFFSLELHSLWNARR